MERRRRSLSGLRSLLLICLFLPSSSFSGSSLRYRLLSDGVIGVNYGRLGSNIPSPAVAVKLLSSLSITRVKVFDMDESVIKAFANTGISLSLCIPNANISSLASNPYTANQIIRRFILRYYPKTKISSISVGNEVSMLPEFALTLLPAMKNLHRSLKTFRLHDQIKVSTTHSLAVLAIRFPPSQAVFQESISETVLRPVLSFLAETKSPFLVNLYPYLTFKEIPYIPIDFALFGKNTKNFNFTDPVTALTYTNLFDLLVDSLNAAAFSLGFFDLELVVTETGWPSKGEEGDDAASLVNAATFTSRLVSHVAGLPIKGTPLRPGYPVVTYIFALFDEDLKEGVETERHWGLFYANGTSKYSLGILSRGKSEYTPVYTKKKSGQF
ncbi:glucan endo-1,3-beta-glucosidase 12-like [Wolffia australiana]